MLSKVLDIWYVFNKCSLEYQWSWSQRKLDGFPSYTIVRHHHKCVSRRLFIDFVGVSKWLLSRAGLIYRLWSLGVEQDIFISKILFAFPSPTHNQILIVYEQQHKWKCLYYNKRKKKNKIAMMCFSNQKHGNDMLLTYKFLFNLFLFSCKSQKPDLWVYIYLWDHIIESICPSAPSLQGSLQHLLADARFFVNWKKKDADNFGIPELPVCWDIFICELNYVWIIKTDRNKINSC